MGGAEPVSDNPLYRMAMDDPTPWYKKPNLRALYLLLFPCVIGIEMTSGFDSQIINAVQIVPAWKACTSRFTLKLVDIMLTLLLQTLEILPVLTRASWLRLSLLVPALACLLFPTSTMALVVGGASCSAQRS